MQSGDEIPGNLALSVNQGGGRYSTPSLIRPSKCQRKKVAYKKRSNKRNDFNITSMRKLYWYKQIESFKRGSRIGGDRTREGVL